MCASRHRHHGLLLVAWRFCSQVLQRLQHPRVLADFVAVFHRVVCAHDETPNQAHDKVRVCAWRGVARLLGVEYVQAPRGSRELTWPFGVWFAGTSTSLSRSARRDTKAATTATGRASRLSERHPRARSTRHHTYLERGVMRPHPFPPARFVRLRRKVPRAHRRRSSQAMSLQEGRARCLDSVVCWCNRFGGGGWARYLAR